MPRTYTTPVSQPAVNTARVMHFDLVVGYDGASVDLTSTYFAYTINSYDENGNAVESVIERILWADIPGPVKTALKGLYNQRPVRCTV